MSLMIGDLNASHLGITAAGGAAGDRPARPRVRSRGDRNARRVRRHGRRAARAGGASRRRFTPAIGSSPSNGRRLGSRREPRRAARQHDRSARRAARVIGRGGAANRRGRRAADESGDREGAAVPAVGGAEPRVRAEGERRPARLRAHDQHERGARSISSTSISTPRTTRATASSSTSATTTAGSSTRTRSTCSRGSRTCGWRTRGVPEAPARTLLGQRALELPTVLVTNQHSLSDAEDFTEGYRTLKLGSGGRRADRRLDHLHVGRRGSSTDRRCACRACASAPPTAATWNATRGRWTSRSRGRSASR